MKKKSLGLLFALLILVFSAAWTWEAVGSEVETSAQRRGSNLVTSVTFGPPSPATKMVGERIFINFGYLVTQSGGARVYVYPHSDGKIVPYRNTGSPLLQGRGSSSTWFTILNGPDLVDGVELRMYNADNSKVLYTKVYNTRFQFDVFKVIDVNVSVASRSFRGACPHTFSFTGKIKVNSGGTVKYRWIRSDGGRGRTETMIFRMAGTQTISSTWTLGGAGKEYKNYWKAIEIIEPNPVISNKATFSLYCNR
jgi:hypothetical protein